MIERIAGRRRGIELARKKGVDEGEVEAFLLWPSP